MDCITCWVLWSPLNEFEVLSKGSEKRTVLAVTGFSVVYLVERALFLVLVTLQQPWAMEQLCCLCKTIPGRHKITGPHIKGNMSPLLGTNSLKEIQDSFSHSLY